MRALPLSLEVLDFRYQNSRVKIIADRNYPQVKLAGLTFGPFQEGNEYDVYEWVAEALAEAGVVHLREQDTIDATKLAKVQWKERIQVASQISELPENFYPKLRTYLAELQAQIAKNPQKIQEYERVKSLALDVVNSRLRKIVTLSTSPMQADQILTKLTAEERLAYMQMGKIGSTWRSNILEHKPQQEQ
jgi:hypothetical protein